MAFPLDLLPPVPNLNGNTKESLQERLTELIHAIAGVEEAIVGCHDCWHGRNFQTLEGGDIIRSLAEGAWRLRMIAMAEMHHSIVELMMKIENGVSPIAEEVVKDAASGGIVVVNLSAVVPPAQAMLVEDSDTGASDVVRLEGDADEELAEATFRARLADDEGGDDDGQAST